MLSIDESELGNIIYFKFITLNKKYNYFVMPHIYIIVSQCERS